MDILTIITARGGSKGIKRKNVQLVGGQPLIAWTIQAARRAHAVSRVVVNTDNQEIASVAQQFGAEVPFMRPESLAQDKTPSMDVLIHAIQWFREYEDYMPDYLLLLQPTSPLREAADIDAAIELAQAKDAEAIVSVSPTHAHPYWMKTISEDGRLEDFLTIEKRFANRQSLPEVYMLNGALYLAKPQVLLDQQTWFTDKTYAYIIPQERSLDIDTPWEMKLADWLLKDRKKENE